MITKWKVFNFKSIQKETELNVAPLTIFAGANSSGKSTVLQSMLLISQTLSHKIGSRSVVLNGSLTRLGQFDDLNLTKGNFNEDISLHFQYVILCSIHTLSVSPLARYIIDYIEEGDTVSNISEKTKIQNEKVLELLQEIEQNTFLIVLSKDKVSVSDLKLALKAEYLRYEIE